MAYPVALGKAGAFFKIPLEQLLIIFMQSFVSNLINVGIKHIPLGQNDGQKILVKLLPNIRKLALKYKECEIDDMNEKDNLTLSSWALTSFLTALDPSKYFTT